QPPPGTSQKTTTANALDIVFQVVTHVLDQAGREDSVQGLEIPEWTDSHWQESCIKPSKKTVWKPPEACETFFSSKPPPAIKEFFRDHRHEPEFCEGIPACSAAMEKYAKHLDKTLAPESDF